MTTVTAIEVGSNEKCDDPGIVLIFIACQDEPSFVVNRKQLDFQWTNFSTMSEIGLPLILYFIKNHLA